MAGVEPKPHQIGESQEGAATGEPAHRTGRVQSGDVSLFYRAFGHELSSSGKAPVLILHGSNYYDSYDWIGVAAALSEDRPVVAFDHRGFGLSGWSEYKDYSLDALLSDIKNVSAHFGWETPVLLGHSMSGRLAVFFASIFSENVSQLVVVDSAMGKGNPGGYKVSVGNAPKVFKSVEDAMAHLAGRQSPPRFALDRERAERALRQVEGGFALKRDPDQKNTQSQAPGAPKPKFRDLDTWAALASVTCPVTFIRGERSDRNKPEYYERIAREFPQHRVKTVDSRHDIAFEAPDELVEVVLSVLDRPA